MTDRAEKNWKVAGSIASIVAVIVVVVGFVYSQSYDSRIGANESNIRTLQTDVKQHKDNSSIHRTAEEAKVYERAEGDRWKQLFRELNQMSNRIENLERRLP